MTWWCREGYCADCPGFVRVGFAMEAGVVTDHGTPSDCACLCHGRLVP